MKILVFILFSIIPLISSGQNTIKTKWVEMDVAIFRYFFNAFPLDSRTTVNDLMTNLKGFKDAPQDSLGLDGILYNWLLGGGYISLQSSVVTYKGKIAMVKTTISKEIEKLNRVFERDITIRETFKQYFKLQKYPNYFNDSIYVYTYKNDSIFENYKMHVAQYLGKQEKMDLTQCKFEYDLLNEPTGRYLFLSYFRISNEYPASNAINKLIYENRIDCIRNIIRGFSLPGRIYGIAALLQMAKEKTYKLSEDDKELIRKVLNLNLIIGEGDDLIAVGKYRDCLKADLLKFIDK
jgi:hypothetical protein